MYHDAEEVYEDAKVAANLNDPETMRDLFNAAASCYYLNNTQKTREELEETGWFANSQWSDWAINCTGKEWDSIEDCIECAEEKAQMYIEEEENA